MFKIGHLPLQCEKCTFWHVPNGLKSACTCVLSVQFSMSAWRNLACLAIKNAHREDSDQTVQMSRLIKSLLCAHVWRYVFWKWLKSKYQYLLISTIICFGYFIWILISAKICFGLIRTASKTQFFWIPTTYFCSKRYVNTLYIWPLSVMQGTKLFLMITNIDQY